MAKLDRSDAVIQLGKQLVAQLDDPCDLTVAWIAHDVAEHMEAVRTATPETREQAREACAAAIFRLWEARNVLPARMRPTTKMDAVLRVIHSLDLQNAEGRYFPRGFRLEPSGGVSEDAAAWLKLAHDLDYTARVLVGFALRAGAQEAVDEAGPWAELAAAADAQLGMETPIIRFVIDEEEGPADEVLEELSDRAGRLEAFVNLAARMAAQVRQEIAQRKGEHQPEDDA